MKTLASDLPESSIPKGLLFGGQELARTLDANRTEALGQSGPNTRYIEDAVWFGVAPGHARRFPRAEFDDCRVDPFNTDVIAGSVDDYRSAEMINHPSMAVNMPAEDERRMVALDERRQ
jgi:hypothetical protein